MTTITPTPQSTDTADAASPEHALTRPLAVVDQRWQGQAPSWLTELRQAGHAHFNELGLPQPRDEEWRQTSLAGLKKLAFTPSSEYDAAEVPPDALAAAAIDELDAHRVVLVDGHFLAQGSELNGLPEGVRVLSLRQAVLDDDAVARRHLGRYARAEVESFTALNTAYLDDGVLIHVPADVRVNKPIHVVLLSRSEDPATPRMTHPRLLVVAEEDAAVQVIEHHVGQADSVYLTNALTEIGVGDRADVRHYYVQRDSKQAFNIATLQVEQGASSHFASHSVLIGGKLVRNNVQPVLNGPHAHSLLNGLYLPDADRVLDNHMRVHHRQPDCESRQFYSGVLSEKARGVFVGRIVVDQIAQRTDAVQNSRGLLLGEQTHLHTRPQLEIFADDVKCTHGATVGELEPQSLFYLRSRGIPEHVARGLLIYSFAREGLARIDIPGLQSWLGRQLIGELGLGDEVTRLLE